MSSVRTLHSVGQSVRGSISLVKQLKGKTKPRTPWWKDNMGELTQSTKLDTLLNKVKPCQFDSYQEFIRALILETLATTTTSFDQLNYNLFALNRDVFHQVTRETTAFFKLLSNKQQCFLPDGPTSSRDQY